MHLVPPNKYVLDTANWMELGYKAPRALVDQILKQSGLY
jgi:hypothetical protein